MSLKTLSLFVLFIIIINPFNILNAENLGPSYKNLFEDEIPFGPVSICPSQNSLGLNWNSSKQKYEGVNFTPATFIVQKIDHRKILHIDS